MSEKYPPAGIYERVAELLERMEWTGVHADRTPRYRLLSAIGGVANSLDIQQRSAEAQELRHWGAEVMYEVEQRQPTR